MVAVTCLVDPARALPRLSCALTVLLGGLLLAPREASGAITLSTDVAPSFGILQSGASGREFILNTDGSITGANASEYLSGAEAGRFTVEDEQAPSTAIVLVDNISPSGGLAVDDATCSYNGQAQQGCDGAGIPVTTSTSGTLTLGLAIRTTTAHAGGDTATISMDVSVAYQ